MCVCVRASCGELVTWPGCCPASDPGTAGMDPDQAKAARLQGTGTKMDAYTLFYC